MIEKPVVTGDVIEFADTDVARRWWSDRAAELSSQAGQQGTPAVVFDEWLTSNVAGSGCPTPMAYHFAGDRIAIHPDVAAQLSVDLRVADGLLWHELGHRADPLPRALRRVGYAAATVAAVIAAWATLFEADGVAAVTFAVAMLLAMLWFFAWWIIARRGEDKADDYALEHGGPGPIMAFLTSSAADPGARPTAVHRHPRKRLARMQRLIA